MRTLTLLLIAGISLKAQWRVMPMPASIRAGTGDLAIREDFRIVTEGPPDPRVLSAAGRLMERMRRLTGLTFSPGTGTGGNVALTVRTSSAGLPVQSLTEDESYQLVIDGQQAIITASNALGALHGMETFYQLITNTPSAWVTPSVTIEDHPRFAWRGLHLDVSRHFMPADLVRRTLDGMAAVKLNVFHWHLSDEQGFRIESKRFPKLQEQGSDGLFYTQDQVRDIVQYARDRGIRVVPEFDMPGHSASWLVGYPELAAGPGPFQIVRTWGISDPTMDPAKPELYAFLDSFIGEMASIFPDEYFHVGGDEVNGKQWAANTTDIPAFMQSHGFKTQHDLQAYFNQQVLKIVTKYGKRMEGWDEILNPALPKDIVIQSWRGAASLSDAAKQGYQGILSSGYYLDHIDSAAKMYLIDPLGGAAASLGAVEQNRILGGEICMWAEYTSAETVESRIWPRTGAIAERFWSPAEVRDTTDMYRRLALVDAELDGLGTRHNTNYRLALERLAGSDGIEALQVLTDVLEPGSLGLRHRVNPNYTQFTPLNRLVDAARPDSATARRFAELVDRYLAHRKDPAVRGEVVRWLTLWSENDARLEPLIASRMVLREAAPVSSVLASISAEALTAVSSAGAPHKSSTNVQTALKPIGEVNLAVAPAIARLIEGK